MQILCRLSDVPFGQPIILAVERKKDEHPEDSVRQLQASAFAGAYQGAQAAWMVLSRSWLGRDGQVPTVPLLRRKEEACKAQMISSAAG